MAPNLKQFNLLAASLANLQVIRPKGYVAQQPSESASYLDWPADESVPESVDLFSAERLQSNLIQASTSDNVVVSCEPLNDAYWTEEQGQAASAPQHADDWLERSALQTEADAYWNEPPTQHHASSAGAETSTLRTASDAYWQESSEEVSSVAYFAWSHRRTASDCYWIM